MRSFFFNMMASGIISGPIVTDGLINYLDFSNPLCYPGSGFVGTDLVTNESLTINGGSIYLPADAKSFSQNGNGMLIAYPGISSDLLGNKDFTVSGWFKLNGGFSSAAPWGFGKTGNANSLNSFAASGNEICISLADVNAFGTGKYYTTADWKHIVWTKKAGVFSRANCEIYVDNVKQTGTGLTNIYGNESTNPNVLADRTIAIGATSTLGTQASNIKIAEFQIYNKVLTATEVAQNWNNTKSRYV